MGVLALPLYTCCSFLVWLTWGGRHEIEERRYALLHATDHHAILAAAQEFLTKKLTYRPDPKWNAPTADYPDPKDPNMPAAVKALRPSTIVTGTDYVQFEMGGGFFHYGLIASPIADFDPNQRRIGLASVKLINGVWYYAEDGKLPSRKP
jgi:hypothetical protein